MSDAMEILRQLEQHSPAWTKKIRAEIERLQSELAAEHEKVVRLQKALRRAGHCLESGFTKDTVILDIRDALGGKK